MSGIDGPSRRGSSKVQPSDDDRPSSAEASRPAVAPWNFDYDKIPAGIQQYDRALFSSPALVVGWPAAQSPSASTSREPSADAAWNAVKNAPMPRLSPMQGAAGCAPRLATAENARSFADGGVPLGLALGRSLITSVPELERFIDEYLAYTASRPAMKGLHDDALRTGSEILGRRLDAELAEQQRAAEKMRLQDRIAPMQVRPPLPIQQRAVVGEVAIPIAKAVTDVAKLVPVVGELVMAAEVLTGKEIGGLGQDLERSERLVSGALLLAPFALEALAVGVRGTAQLARLARASGKSTEETRSLLRAVRTIKDNEVALREVLAAKKAGRSLTREQATALRAADGALAELRGAAAQSIFDIRSKAGLPVRSFALNANSAVRSLDEASAIARRQGVSLPSWIRIEVDPSIREAVNFAEYKLGNGEFRATTMADWSNLAPDGTVVVRVHPSVLLSEEKIVAVLQHETWELTQLRARVEARQRLPADVIRSLIDGRSATNLHGQAWNIADLRVLIMRESEPAKKAQLIDRLTQLSKRYQEENLR